MTDLNDDKRKTLSSCSAVEAFRMACLAFGNEKLTLAVEYARAATEKAPGRSVFHHAASYLEHLLQNEKTDVYINGEAFGAFIRGGGNRLLYERTSAALRAAYEEYERFSLLDIGVGDGLALLPALCENIQHLSILEPSEPMLQRCRSALEQRGAPPYQAIHSDVQHFTETSSEHWDLIESTFCLHTIAPEERMDVLAWMRAHGTRLLLAEFDVPAFPDMYALERVQFLVERYEQGFAEYADDGGFVAQGFLMPVMLGNFDRTGARMTYEHTVDQWRTDLKAVGFQCIECKSLSPYWWSTAYLLDAS